MKNHWAFKLTVFILAVLSAAMLAVSGICIIVGYEYDLYREDSTATVESLIQEQRNDYAWRASHAIAAQWLRDQRVTEGTEKAELWDDWIGSVHDMGYWPECEYTVYDPETGSELKNTTNPAVVYAETLSQTISVSDGRIVPLGSSAKDFPHYEELPVDYVWTDHAGNPLPGLDSETLYYDLATMDNYRIYRVEHFEPAEFRVDIHLTQEDLNYLSSNLQEVSLIRAAEPWLEISIPAAVISAVVCLLSFLYLGFAAGKKPGTDEIQPRGTNRLPLDLVAVGGGLGGLALLAGGAEMINAMGYSDTVEGIYGVYWYTGWYALCAGALALVAALMLTALCAQVRMGNGAWYKRTMIGKCWNFFWDLLKRAVRFVGDLIRLVPLMWQWLIGFGLWLTVMTLICLDGIWYHEFLFLLLVLIGAGLVLYCGYALGKLRNAAKRMGSGDLDTKIDTKKAFLFGNFREFADDLNTLGDTCEEAAVARTKSERMKSELITNVSHDIKTPLTSIINYVDLLQRAETEEQKAEFLEVLDRQSQRLKKLIEDLMEMSKASSGNIAVELGSNDVVEAVNQALGEFADRLEGQNLSIVFRQSGESVPARCDGKLLWRVMSNVLVNVVKYALPGTRVYIDVLAAENKVYVSFKNISREPLNISADELMERFVRGDRSRNSEGNGLGLNIAKSLMEAQGGDLSLTIDGDLFKVTLTLNAG